MFKVIVERPRLRRPRRGGSLYPRGSLENKFERDLEEAPRALGMGFPHREKWLNENLAPLRRFLRASVGRPWSRVRSEIGEHLSVRSAVQKHVLDHLRDFVIEDVVMVGKAPHVRRWRGLEPLTDGRYEPLYVCPVTGLLRVGPRRRRAVLEAAERVVAVGGGREVWRVGGALVSVGFRRLPELAEDRGRCFDVLLGSALTPGWFDHSRKFVGFYGHSDRFAAEKREPGLRELGVVRKASARRR